MNQSLENCALTIPDETAEFLRKNSKDLGSYAHLITEYFKQNSSELYFLLENFTDYKATINEMTLLSLERIRNIVRVLSSSDDVSAEYDDLVIYSLPFTDELMHIQQSLRGLTVFETRNAEAWNQKLVGTRWSISFVKGNLDNKLLVSKFIIMLNISIFELSRKVSDPVSSRENAEYATILSEFKAIREEIIALVGSDYELLNMPKIPEPQNLTEESSNDALIRKALHNIYILIHLNLS
jgi:hypothetical protein